MLELVDIPYSTNQNWALAESFKKFHRLPSAPKVERKLVLEKDEFTRFLKQKTRERTQFEANPSIIELNFDSFSVPFQFIATYTKFTLPSGRFYELYEELDSPNGKTKRVDAFQNGEKVEFSRYIDAELYVLDKFLEEIQIGDSN